MDDPHATGEHQRSGIPRRADERAVAENVTWLATKLAEFIEWVARVRWALVAIVGAVVTVATGLNAYASWAGAQRSSPAARYQSLETRVDAGLLKVNNRMDSLVERLAHHDSVRAARERDLDLDLDFIIRLGCRSMRDADLMSSCRRRGAIR